VGNSVAPDLAPSDRWRPARVKVAAVLAVAILVTTAYAAGVFDRFDNPARVTATLVQLGPWGYLTFIATYAALQPFGIPGTVFVVAAPLIWPWPLAFGLSMTGTMLASIVGFSFARLVAREWVARSIPARFRRYDDALARNGFRTVFLMRLVFWMPPLLHAFFGVSKVRFWTHFWGSFLGYLVPLFLMSFFGQALFDALRRLL
jgi:uncharacterized membrane protein YdjX (TVP38/TMEM64 family)